MITSLQIRGYINFLYLQRNGTNAPQELLNKWSALPNDGIAGQLQNLYSSWQLSAQDAQQYEAQFLQAIAARVPKPAPETPAYVPPAYTPPSQQDTYVQQPPPANQSLWKKIIGITALALVVGFLFFKFGNKSNNESIASLPEAKEKPFERSTTTAAPVADTTVTVAPAQPVDSSAASAVESEEPDPQNEPEDEVNMSVMRSLIAAEESENFEDIYSKFSPNMEQYWDLAYPTRSELETRYKKQWAKTMNRKHENVQVQKIDNHQYLLTGIFTYYGVNSKQTKSVPFKNIYKFDDNGNILVIKDAR
jgi:hypothetical protein